jgi:ABC-2 type transport system permease protein
MRLSKSWVIALKDFKIFRRKKNVIYSIIALPLIVSFLIPTVIEFAGHRNGASGIPAAKLLVLLPAFIFFYLIIAAYLPTPIASYSLVGEKVEKSLEPLLATPTTDDEILLGKGIAAFLPSIGAALGGAAIFMVLIDLVTYDKLGYYYFPDWNTGVVLLLLYPLACVMSVEANVIISSRVSDVRVAQQLGVLMVLPFAGIYVAGELNIISLGDTSNLLIISGVLLLADLLLLYVARATFRREEILTKWK